MCASLSVYIISDSSFFHQIRTHQEMYQGLISKMFTIDTFPENCLFACIASALHLDGAVFSEEELFTATNVRAIVADYIIEMKGDIYNHRVNKFEGSVSETKFTKHVRKPRKRTEFISCFMHLQALGIRDGSFIGGDKELDLLVEIFMLNVQVYDSSDALPPAGADSGDLEYSEELVSLDAPESNDRQGIVLLRNNDFEYSLLFTRPPHTPSPVPAASLPLVKAPKVTTYHRGEFPGGNMPRVLPSPSPPPSLSLFVYFDIFPSPPQELILNFKLPGVESRKEIQLQTSKHILELTVSDSSCCIEFTF